VDLYALPFAVEPAGEMLPSGHDLGHQIGRLQPLDVPLARLALDGEIRLVRLVPVDDVADDVMHWPVSPSSSR